MKKMLKNKNVMFAFLGITLGIVLVLLGNIGNSESGTSNNSNTTEYTSAELESYTASLENKITNIVEKIGGVSNVSVVLTIEGSNETVYATEGANKDYVIINDGSGKENALQVMEISATVRGIAVVCDYGDDDKLKGEIIAMLTSLFNIGSNRVSVISA